jgi:hypothetical protein
MSLKPMGDTVFGDPIVQEDESTVKLVSEIHNLAQEYIDALGPSAQLEFSREARRLEAIAQPEKVYYMMTVTDIGPECVELQPGDTAILAPYSGTMITVVNEETQEPRRVFCISESAVLARYRED